MKTAHAAMEPRADDADADDSLRTVSRPRSPAPGAVSETSLGVERARRLADARDAYDAYDEYDARERDDGTQNRDHIPSPSDDSRSPRTVPPPRTE